MQLSMIPSYVRSSIEECSEKVNDWSFLNFYFSLKDFMTYLRWFIEKEAVVVACYTDNAILW